MLLTIYSLQLIYLCQQRIDIAKLNYLKKIGFTIYVHKYDLKYPKAM